MGTQYGTECAAFLLTFFLLLLVVVLHITFSSHFLELLFRISGGRYLLLGEFNLLLASLFIVSIGRGYRHLDLLLVDVVETASAHTFERQATRFPRYRPPEFADRFLESAQRAGYSAFAVLTGRPTIILFTFLLLQLLAALVV